MTNWMHILQQQAASRSRADVARELGVSPSTISLVLAGKYPASTAGIEARVMALYGCDGKVRCPVMGLISPSLCVTCWERAKKIGVRCGNPATIRLYRACLKCELRS